MSERNVCHEPRLVRIVIVPSLEPGVYRKEGIRIVCARDDAELGREMRTVEMACHSETEAARLREIVAEREGLELAE